MHTPNEAEAGERRNYERIQEMIRVTCTMDYNLRQLEIRDE